MNNNTIDQQLKAIDVTHLDEGSMDTLRQVCRAEQITQITHIETLISLTKTLSRLTSQSSEANNWLALQSSEQWQATLAALSEHDLLNNNNANFQKRGRCLVAILIILKNVMEQLAFRKALVWQHNTALTTALNRLLQIYAASFDAVYMNSIITALKYIDAPSWSGFDESIESSLMANLINQLDRLDDKHKVLCLRNLALWHIEQSMVPDWATTCLHQIFEDVFDGYKQQLSNQEYSITFKRALVQSFYALTVHECFGELSSQFSTSIGDLEYELKQRPSRVSKSESFCLGAIEKRLLPINKQALIGGYPVDGLVEIDKEQCVVEIDGKHHNRFKQYLIDDYRDRLLSQLGYWVVRIDLAKLPYTGQGEYCETELSFLTQYLKSLSALENLTYNAEPQSFIKKALAPVGSDELYNLQEEEMMTLSQVSESSTEQINSDEHPYKQMLEAVKQQTVYADETTHRGKTVLHMAIQSGCYEDVCALTDQYKADVTMYDTENHSPLELAKIYGYKAIFEKLMITLNKALMQEIRSPQDRPNKVIKLLKAGASLYPFKPPRPSVLCFSIIWNKPATFEKIDAHYPNLKYEPDPKLKQSILQTAIAQQRYQMVRSIIDNRLVNINFTDVLGRTALHYAIMINDYNAVCMVLNQGRVDPTIQYNEASALQLAQKKAGPEIQRQIQNYLDYLLVDKICSAKLTEAKINYFVDRLIEAGAQTNCSPPIRHNKLAGENYSPLQAAIALNKVEVIKHLLFNYRVSLNTLDEDTHTPLYYIFEGDIDNGEVLDFLLSQPSTVVNSQNQSGNTVLHGTFILGHYHFAEKLIQHARTQLDLANNNGDTALHLAFDKQAPASLVKQLLKRLHDNNQLISQLYKPNNVQNTPLSLALKYGDLNYLKDYNLNFNQPAHHLGCSPSHVTAFYGHLSDLKFLIAQGADLQATDKNQDNVLHYAVSGKQPAVVGYLLQEHKLNINQCNLDGETMLHVVVRRYNQTIAQMLTQKQYQADLTIKDSNNRTPYSAALHQYGKNNVLSALFHERLVSQLNEAIQHGNDQPEEEIKPILDALLHSSNTLIQTASQQDSVINPVIHDAVNQGFINTVRYLMEHYSVQMAKPDTKEGTTLLYKAVETNHYDLTQTLLNTSNSQTSQCLLENKYALMEKAIENDNPGVMIQLLQRLYDLNQADNSKVSPSKPRNNKKKRNKNKKKEADDPASFDFMVFLKNHLDNMPAHKTTESKLINLCLKTLTDSDKRQIPKVLSQFEEQFCSSNDLDKENELPETLSSPQSATNPRKVSSDYSISKSPFSLTHEHQSIIEPRDLYMASEGEISPS